MKSKDLRLLLSLGSSRKLLFGAVIGAVLNTAIVIANAFLIAAVIVGIIYDHPSTTTHIVQLAALWIFRSIFTSQFDRWASTQASRLKAQLRSDVLSRQTVVTSTSSSHLTTLLVKGANSLDIYLARFLPQMFGAVLTPLAVISAIALQDLTSAVIAVLTLPIIPFFGALIGRYTNDAVTSKWQSLGMLSRYFEDSLRGIFTLAVFGREKSQGDRIKEMGDRYTSETMKVLRVSFLSALVLELAATISVALIAVSIGLRLVGGSMQFFPALAVLVLAPEVYFPLRNAASLFHASADGGAALAEITKLAESSQDYRNGDMRIDKVRTISWATWKSPFTEATLESVELHSGDIIVLRGESGVGKSTFLNSIIGLHQGAEVSVNEIKLQSIERESLFRTIGWIPQNPSLISGSVRELFSLLPRKFTDQEMIGLLNKVGLPLSALHHGLDTHISGMGEKSGEISGGQKRRLAIARALAVNPSLFIVDEPTADLDPDSAQMVLALLKEVADRGAIVIAILHAPDQSIEGAREIVMEER